VFGPTLGSSEKRGNGRRVKLSPANARWARSRRGLCLRSTSTPGVGCGRGGSDRRRRGSTGTPGTSGTAGENHGCPNRRQPLIHPRQILGGCRRAIRSYCSRHVWSADSARARRRNKREERLHDMDCKSGDDVSPGPGPRRNIPFATGNVFLNSARHKTTQNHVFVQNVLF